jgi:hypothetical protein
MGPENCFGLYDSDDGSLRRKRLLEGVGIFDAWPTKVTASGGGLHSPYPFTCI